MKKHTEAIDTAKSAIVPQPLPQRPPLPQQLFEVIRDAIRQQYIPEESTRETRIPSNRELSDLFGVNTGTISKALHELELEGLIYRRVGKGTFALPRAKPAPKAIGVYFGSEIMAGGLVSLIYARLDAVIQKRLHDDRRSFRHFVDVRIPELQTEPLPELTRAIEEKEIASLVVLRARRSEYNWLRGLPVPVVGLCVQYNATSVFFDYLPGLEDAIRDLRRRGAKRIALVCPRNHRNTLHPDRIPYLDEGFRLAMREAGAEINPAWTDKSQCMEAADTEAFRREGYRQTVSFCAGNDRPDAIISYPDSTTLGVLDALRKLGLEAGRDLELVSHANREMIWPELSGIGLMYLSTEGLADSLCQAVALSEMQPPSTEPILHPMLFAPRETAAKWLADSTHRNVDAGLPVAI